MGLSGGGGGGGQSSVGRFGGGRLIPRATSLPALPGFPGVPSMPPLPPLQPLETGAALPGAPPTALQPPPGATTTAEESLKEHPASPDGAAHAGELPDAACTL